jgi:predicted acylesterase/phospholipase RssA
MVKANIIRVSPGGLKGFYILGILNYLRNHYIMDHYIYSGASAGAWNSLIMCSKRDNKFVNQFIDSLFVPVSRSKSIEEIQYLFKHKLLDSFDSSDFDFSRLHIGVVTMKDRQIKTQIYTNFTDLTDAIECCMSSSHIPLVTGKLVKNYRNNFVFDGGFSSDPYIKSSNYILYVEPNMWTDKKDQKFIVNEFIDNFSMSRNNPEQLYMAGYSDAIKNDHYFAHLKKIKK